MIAHITSLTPHEIKSTLSLNRVRIMLETMKVELDKISTSMQNNLDKVKRRRDELEIVEACSKLKAICCPLKKSIRRLFLFPILK
jgi:hypothetical protein